MTVERDVLDKHGVDPIRRSDEFTEPDYLSSPERRITHPAVTAITQAAPSKLFH